MAGMVTEGLLERAAQLDALEKATNDAAAGHGSVVLVTGEAGVGKTSLVRTFVRGLPRAGGPRVLVGVCDDLHVQRELGPLRDAALGIAGPLAKALADVASSVDVYAAVAAELAGPEPTLLVVEDVHWADDATLDVLRYLVRRIHELPAVVVLTFRDGEVPAVMRQLLETLGGVPRHRIALAPLSVDAVGVLAAGSGRDPAALHAVTGGNPFYVIEALGVSPGEVPATVADAVLAQVRRLGGPSRQALEQLSVVPSHVGLELAEILLKGRIEALAEAEEHGILQVRADGLAFRHELARRAIEQSLPVLRRRAYHREVLRVLEFADRRDAARLVHHAVGAQDAQTVIRYAPRAGRLAARVGAHRQALAHFEAALSYAYLLDTADLARLVDDYAWELYNAHRFTEAVDAGRTATELYERLGDPVALGESLVRLSRHIYMVGDTGKAHDAVERAVRIIEPVGESSALAYAMTYRGASLALADRPADALPTLRQAREIAARASRDDLVALCLNYLGVAGAELNGPDALADLRAGLAMAKAGHFHECIARGYTNLGELVYRYGLYEELAQCVKEGLDFTLRRGFWSHAYNLEVHRCLLLMRQGDWAAAENGLRSLMEGQDDPGMLYVYSVPPYARLLARRGDQRAGPMLAEAWDRAMRQRSMLGIAYAGLAYVEWSWLNGTPETAVPVRDALLRRTERPGAAPIRGELMRYLARAGLGGEAFDGCPEPHASGLRGDWRRAAELCRDPYERALELAESGERAPTLEALETLEGLGAHAAVARVRERLHALGVVRKPRGPAATTKANPAGLTHRQMDVLALLADGLTNAEIADRLVLSARTVDHHVSAILTKLGVANRRQAARCYAAARP